MTTVGTPTLPQGAYAVALASLPGSGPGWLVGMLRRHSPQEAWRCVLDGRAAPPRRRRGGTSEGPGDLGLELPARGLVEAARTFDVKAAWDYCLKAGVQVSWPGAAGYPASLGQAPGRPGVLFWVGDISLVMRLPVVALVGTRRCTPDGAQTAYELARDLAAAGVCVVSGLALGIDGAAHAGALAGMSEAPLGQAGATVGVAASGVDVVYPRQHGALWRRVAATGAIVSETPPRKPAQPWRFPARNRVIAGLARMVVVVECHLSGGSWHTVEAALRCGVEVGAVPGPVRSPASDGTNMMIREGATPVRSALDVLDSLGLGSPPAPPKVTTRALARPALAGRAVSGEDGPPGVGRGSKAGPGPVNGIGVIERRVLDAVGWRPACLDDVVERAGLPVGPVALCLGRLEEAGVLASEGGWWWRAAPAG